MFRIDDSGVFRCSAFERIGWLDHGFGSRLSPNWLNNWNVASLRQIHSDLSLVVESGSGSGCAGEGDALITASSGQMISVRTADCLPILLVAEKSRVVAAVHAGWRGSAARIARKTVERLRAEFGAAPSEIQAALGPAIGPCCYEVGPEVLTRFRDLVPGLSTGDSHGMLDLGEANRRDLMAAGVPEGNIHGGAPCTSCHPELFFSYRRQPGETGRMTSAIAVRQD